MLSQQRRTAVFRRYFLLFITLVLCTGMCVASLLIPGYIRPGGWWVAFVAVTLFTAGGSVYIGTIRQRTARPAFEAALLYGTDLAIVIALAGLTDRSDGRIGAILLVLPTIFFALFLPPRLMVAQMVLVSGFGATLMLLGGDRGSLLAVHTATVTVSVLMPGWSIIAVRLRLDTSLRRERESAITDQLTGLENRRGLTERFEQALASSKQAGATVGLLLIDLDRFKEVNDTLGHDCGDELLAQIGIRLKSMLRGGDTVARLGGDEFCVLLPTVDGLPTAMGIAERLRAALIEPFTLKGVEVETEASIGVVVSGTHGSDVTTLLRRADVAMYVAKRRNLGTFAYEREADQHTPERLALIGRLRRGMDRKELFLHYQPKVSLSTGTVVGAEALVRWKHPERGIIPPDEFIPLAESTGLISPLTQYVLDSAISQARTFADSGLAIPIAVNLSTRNLLETGLCDQINELLQRHDIPPDRLKLEVTESAIMLDPIRASYVLAQLNELGIETSIDDFGAGYTSIAQLKLIPIKELKVDRSFVMGMDTDPSDSLIVQSIIGLGHNLGFTVVAEGVESLESMKTLASFGCDIAQGYHLSKPLAPEDFVGWCVDHNQRVTAARAEGQHGEQQSDGGVAGATAGSSIGVAAGASAGATAGVAAGAPAGVANGAAAAPPR